jgi:colanic acid biosynthesis glycosyl transferase WcaI
MNSTAAVSGGSRQPRRIWFVSELFWPEETSTGYFLTRIAEDSAALHEVHAVCNQPTYAARGTLAPRRELRHGIRIERMRATQLDKDVLPFRLLNLVTFSISVFVHLMRRLRRDDVVVAVTNPPVVPYLAQLAAARRGARLVVLVHDLYPEVLVAVGAARPHALHVRVLHAASRWLYRRAERVIVLGRDMDALVSRKLPPASRPPVLIPNWGDVECIQPDPDAGAALRERLGLQRKFVVGYTGNMGRTHDLRTLVDAATLLGKDERFHFLFVGWGAQRAWLEREIAARDLTNVSVDGACAPDELSAFLNAADVAVIAFRRGMAGVSVPSRLYNVMAAGRPVVALADTESELAQVVTEERIGWVVEPENAAAAAGAFCQAATDHDALVKAGRLAREAAVRRYSRTVISAEWLRLFHELDAKAERVPA